MAEDEEKKTKGSDWPGPRIGRKGRIKRRKMAKAAKKSAARKRKKK